jgi:hypothetical protein
MPKKEKIKEQKEPKDKKDKKQKGKPDYKIYGVRKQEEFMKLDRELPRFLETLTEKNGGVVGIFAPPGSGKSNFLSNLLLRDDFLKDMFEGGLYIISPTIENDLTSHALKEYADFTETQYSEALMESIFQHILDQDAEDRALSCLLLDDCLGAIKQHTICNRIASTCRHNKQVVIFSLQAVKGLPPTIRSNISHSIIFYQPSTKQLNDVVELHSNMGGEEAFRAMYEEATAEKYGFLACDWRDMKAYKWGAELDEPVLLWSRYDENGNISKGVNTELNKGKLENDSINKKI